MNHILYGIISAVIIVGLLLLFRFVRAFQSQWAKNLILFFISLTTFLIHISEIWLATLLGAVNIADADIGGLLIMSPCSASMLAMLIVGVMAVRGRYNAFARWAAAGVAYIGFIGAFPTVYLSPVYAGHIDFFVNWYMTANLFAHSVLMLGCFYLITGGFVKVKVANALPVLILGAAYYIIGGLDILLLLLFREDFVAHNPMYFFRPFGDAWMFYGYVLWAVAVAFTCVITLFYELVFIKPKDRFYKNWNKNYWLKQ
jgi:hypothetical protein